MLAEKFIAEKFDFWMRDGYRYYECTDSKLRWIGENGGMVAYIEELDVKIGVFVDGSWFLLSSTIGGGSPKHGCKDTLAATLLDLANENADAWIDAKKGSV